MTEEISKKEAALQVIHEKQKIDLPKIQPMPIKTSEDLERAKKIDTACKEYKKFVCEKLDPIIKDAHDAHKKLVALKKEELEPILKIESLNLKYGKEYRQEQRRLEEEARQKAIREQEEKRLAEAEELQKAGMAKEADRVMEKRITVPKDEIPEKPDFGGMRIVERWKAIVIDKMALIKAIAEGKADSSLLDPNMPNLNELARKKKIEGEILPGVRAEKS